MLFKLFSMLFSIVVFVLKAVWLIGFLACWGLTVQKFFGEKKKTQGYLSIVPLFGFILGWIHAKKPDDIAVMVVWSVLAVIALWCGWIL